jgi:hypothetical protein
MLAVVMVVVETNPYRSPGATRDHIADHRSIVGTMFFAINFVFAVFIIFISVVAVVQSETPYSLLGGIMLLPVAAGVAIIEWVAWYRRKHALERFLGGLCFGVGALAAFGVIANVAEALNNTWPDGFEWFVGVGLAIASYFVACGAWRIWHSVIFARKLGGQGRR